MITDVIIAGRGIAAMVLSLLLKQKNIPHVVLGRQGRPKDFALAETLPPSALPLLKTMGLLPLFENTAIQKTYGYHSMWGTNKVTDTNFFFHRPYQYGLKIDKQAILSALSTQQKDHIHTYSDILVINNSADGIELTLKQENKTETIQGKILIDATGRNRVILEKLNVPSLHFDNMMAFSCHIPLQKHPAIKHPVFIESFEQGWGIVSILNETQSVFSLFTNKVNPGWQEFRKYENWSKILANTTLLKDFALPYDAINAKGCLSNSSKAQTITGHNWLAIGDAALAFDPLSSHGITNSLYTTQTAASCIEKHLNKNTEAMHEYAQNLNEIFDQYLKTKNLLYTNERRWPKSPFWLAAGSQTSVFD